MCSSLLVAPPYSCSLHAVAAFMVDSHQVSPEPCASPYCQEGWRGWGILMVLCSIVVFLSDVCTELWSTEPRSGLRAMILTRAV